jgi:hypothetical protein
VLHTASLLNDGRVLIAGGTGSGSGGTTVASAEIYDPATGKFTPTGSMHTARETASATLLADGRVLILGGEYGGGRTGGFVSSAEIYDPATGLFSGAGSMAGGYLAHTATRLPDGRVLIAGGMDLKGTTDKAWLFDPATGTFSPTGSMMAARAGHTATLLRNGLVLVVGGAESRVAELYDPATGTFRQTGSTRQDDQTATLLKDGRVLIAGGNALPPLTAEIYWP